MFKLLLLFVLVNCYANSECNDILQRSAFLLGGRNKFTINLLDFNLFRTYQYEIFFLLVVFNYLLFRLLLIYSLKFRFVSFDTNLSLLCKDYRTVETLPLSSDLYKLFFICVIFLLSDHSLYSLIIFYREDKIYYFLVKIMYLIILLSSHLFLCITGLWKISHSFHISSCSISSNIRWIFVLVYIFEYLA